MSRPTNPSQKRKESPSEDSTEDSIAPSKRPRPSPDTTRCFLLELPRELRDMIYFHVLALESRVTLKVRSFITKSGLVGVNAQIGEEFLDAVMFHAPVLHTTVRNHNFAHVVTFVNKLSEAQVERFKSKPETASNSKGVSMATSGSSSEATEKPTKPQRRICITLSYTPTKTSTKTQLNRWLDRFDDPGRRGAELEFEYVLDRESWGRGGYKQRPKGRSTEGPGASRESGKIMAACRGTGPYWPSR